MKNIKIISEEEVGKSTGGRSEKYHHKEKKYNKMHEKQGNMDKFQSHGHHEPQLKFKKKKDKKRDNPKYLV